MDIRVSPYTASSENLTRDGDHVQAIVNVTDNHKGYHTIQSAIDAASAGDVIEVSSGLYEEQITMNKAGLHLQAKAGSEPVIQFQASSSQAVVTFLSSGILEGFVIDGVVNLDLSIQWLFIENKDNVLTPDQLQEIVSNNFFKLEGQILEETLLDIDVNGIRYSPAEE